MADFYSSDLLFITLVGAHVVIYSVLLFGYTAILLLNAFIIWVSLATGKIGGTFKQLLLPNSLNNIIIINLVVFRYIPILNRFTNSYCLEDVTWTLGICAGLGVYIYKLPLTINRFCAVFWPLRYDGFFTDCHLYAIAFMQLVFPYFLFMLLQLLYPFKDDLGAPLSVIFIVCVLVNQMVHISIVFKLRSHLKKQTYGNVSTHDPTFLELRQVVKMNFLQWLIPFLLQCPVVLIVFLQNMFSMNSCGLFGVFQILARACFLAGAFIDPLCVIMIIGSYRSAWKEFMIKGKCKRRTLYCAVFIVNFIVLFCIFLL